VDAGEDDETFPRVCEEGRKREVRRFHVYSGEASLRAELCAEFGNPATLLPRAVIFLQRIPPVGGEK
jgi:hypothetical protein